MNRREFVGSVAFGLLAGPLAAEAQQTGRVYRMTILGNVPLTDVEGARLWGALSQGLREPGYVEGQNLIVEHRFSEGQCERLPALAAELVRWKPDVIVVPNNSNALAARKATQTIPIVAATFTEGSGLIVSLARPGVNVTGLTLLTSGMVGKQLELLKEIVPRVRRVAILWNPATLSVQAIVDEARGALSVQAIVDEAREAARTLGLQLQVLEARRPEDFESAFTSMSRERAGALLVLADAMLILQRRRIADLAARSHLPAMYMLREYMEANGVAFYGPSMIDRRAAVYVDKILKGPKRHICHARSFDKRGEVRARPP